MALSAVCTWEVRTTGNDGNSGGFVTGASGTDYSQQDASQYNAADLASSNGTTNPSVVTSASHNFVAADVGNIIRITAGTNWTTGFYQIVSCAANAATLDRAVGTAASLTGGTYVVGGAFASPGQAGGAKAQGNDVWIKAGTYTISSTSANVSGGRVSEVFSTGGGVGQSNKARWRGYSSSRGDLTYESALSSNPVLQVDPGGSVTNITVFGFEGNHSQAFNLTVDGQDKTGIIGFQCNNSYNAFVCCWATNCTSFGFEIDDNSSYAIRCFADSGSGTAAFALSKDLGSNVAAFYCVAKSNACPGFRMNAGSKAVGCYAISNTGAGFEQISVGYIVIDCVAYGNTGDGFKLDSNAGFASPVINCISGGNGGEGFGTDGSVKEGVFLLKGAGFSNTGGSYSGSMIVNDFEFWNIDDPFVDAANGDFRLNATAGAGATIRGEAFPSVFPGLTLTTNFRDLGPAQHQLGGVLRGLMTGGSL